MVKRKKSLTPQGWYKSPTAGKVHYQSGYEKKFMEWLDSKKIPWEKCRERFLYTALDGKEHRYNPDFYLPEPKLYVEVKGMVRANDPLKFQYFPENKKLVLLGFLELQKLGLDVKDPTAGKVKKLEPGVWPYNLLQQMPDFLKAGEMTEELKKKVDSFAFFEYIKNIAR